MVRTLKFKSQSLNTLKEFKEFTFIGNTIVETSETDTDQLNPYPNSNYLINTNPGKSLLVRQIHGAKNIISQLKNLNFKPGQKVELINKTSNGSVVVSIDNKLIGIGTEIAKNIVVTLAK